MDEMESSKPVSEQSVEKPRQILTLKNYRPGDHRPEIEMGTLPVPTAQLDAPPARCTRSQAHYMTSPKVFLREDGQASDEEYEEAYNREYMSWLTQGVFSVIKGSEVPKGANIISSHVIYRWKNRDEPGKRLLKARIVPHGNHDSDRNDIRKDSPAVKPEIFRLVCCFAADFKREIRCMDIKTAFL